VTAPTWPSVVAAVPHDAGCASVYRATIQDGATEWGPSPRPCNCTRDARIGAGIAAALASARLWRGNHGQIDDAAAVAAFREASKPKEVEG